MGSSRGVFDLYSDELPAAEQTARASSVRFFLDDKNAQNEFRISVFERFHEGFDIARVQVPTGFSSLSPEARAAAALDVIHVAMLALAPLRGWDAARLDEVRLRVVARGLRFTWASVWKTSPGRRHQARAVYWLDDDGHGHVQVEMRRYSDHELIARSAPAPAFMTAEGFKRSATTLHWRDADTVTVTPWCGLFGDVSGEVHLQPTSGLNPLLTPALMATASGTTVTTAVLTDDDVANNPALPWLHLQVIDTHGTGAYGPEFERTSELLAADPDFTSWWDQTPFRRLILRISVPDPRWSDHSPKAGARKNGEDLVLQVVTARAGLPPKADVEALRSRARHDLHQALVKVAAARKLPRPPELPARVFMNGKQWRAQAAGQA